jgi:hypothetical protein
MVGTSTFPVQTPWQMNWFPAGPEFVPPKLEIGRLAAEAILR